MAEKQNNEYKVLIVTDVQNCFIQGGSLSLAKIPDLLDYITQVEAIVDKIKTGNYNLVVFSRDSHPEHHASLMNKVIDPPHGVYIPHCRDKKKTCPQLYDQGEGFTTIFQSNPIKASDWIDNLQNMLNKLKALYDVKALINSYFSENERDQLELNNLKITSETIEILEQIIQQYLPIEINKRIQQLEKILTFFNNDYNDRIMAKNYDIIGNNISYLFYFTYLFSIIYELNNNNLNTISVKKENVSTYPNIDFINIPNIADYNSFKTSEKILKILNLNKTKFIQLLKGEYCNYESYSAFNYHKQIINNKNEGDKFYDYKKNVVEDLPVNKNFSTGLFEYIYNDIKDINNKEATNKINTITVDVCGLVTNICVINTVQQGLALWHGVYKNHQDHEEFKNIKTFNMNLLEYAALPLILDDKKLPPHIYYPYSKRVESDNNTEQINILIKLFQEKYIFDIFKVNPNLLADQDTFVNNYKFNLYITKDIYLEVKPYENTQKLVTELLNHSESKGGKKHTKKCCCLQCKKAKTKLTKPRKPRARSLSPVPKTPTKARKPRAKSPSPVPKTSARKRASSPVRKTNTPRKPKTVTPKK